MGKKIYIIKKIIVADSVLDAHKKEKKHPPDEIFLEGTTMKDQVEQLLKKKEAIGI